MTSVTDPVPPGPPSGAEQPGAVQVGAVQVGAEQAGEHAGSVQQIYPPYPPQDRISRFFDRLWHRSPVWVAPIALFTCMAGAVGYTLAVDPTDSAAGDPPTCLLKYTTGFVCPGCGGTRAAWYLLHGDVPAAARHHLLFVFVVPFLIYLYVAWAGRRMFGWRIPQLDVSPRAIGIFLAVWGVWSVLRNLPWAPFTWFFV
jgi:hypothetical protein